MLLFAVTTDALAHQAKESVTRVLFNNRTGNIEVMHRFLAHDAEHAIRQIFDGNPDVLLSQNERERFTRYVSERFTLRDQDGTELPLHAVGNEIDGAYLWIYFESAIPTTLKSLTVTHDALRDLWPAQTNLVTVERNGETASALFAKGAESITIELGSHSAAQTP
ncbi:MAG: DUF6702 family protein [Pseudomonadota bacterium]